ncbi:glycoside hydrolase family 3 C-terminal domain-containing protein [Neobacillus sp. SuZ13]|uniref:glycoside hydrolase family 3 C-terminal domain-containing protein n=1 Tax=Neobacillus sp. SuZ13 TaxID=3047875 RepID=UPI0024BFAE9A|nr:glycoside hydrolase family 3 C-terminal domain-containing protein [Neobacillus sp. SuZ13]WHY66679.1 glycoside hydrolase family 3 C-terminal domain-containing protein [Neobacillus sp. SuZ13]
MSKLKKMRKRKKTLSLLLTAGLGLSLFSSLPVQAANDGSAGTKQNFSVQASKVVSKQPIYLDKSYSFHERAADLVSRMTLEEKASQMNSSSAPAIPRLGVKAYGWWNEALHGVARTQYNPTGNATVLNNTTSYPMDLALGSTWDPQLMYKEATMISDEAREVAPENTLMLDYWSPTINLARDPRWGRNDESYGEDPFLTTQIASQFVNGMEGKDMDGKLLPEGDGYLKTVTTIKHYVANNSEVNRLNGSSNVDERSLREYFSAPFKGVVEKSNVSSVMTSYNSINGVPGSANVHTMDTLLRQTFGFSGYEVSDCDAVYEVSNPTGHNWTPPGWTRPVNQIERTAFSIGAGEDLNCNAGYSDGYSFGNTVPAAISQKIVTPTGTFSENDVDTALIRLFTARMQLGEFDDPNSVPWVKEARERVPEGTWTNSNDNNAITKTKERLDMARKVAGNSLVLLKNSETTQKDGSKGKLLPLKVPASGSFKVAVVGYFANPDKMYLGGYSSDQGSAGTAKMVNAYNGIKNAITAANPNAEVTYYKGFTDQGTTAKDLKNVDPAAVEAAKNADVVIVYGGTDNTTADEAGDRHDLNLPGAQASLIDQVAKANPNTIAVMETIGQVEINSFEKDLSAMIWSSYNGERKGEGLADVLLGKHNPSGHLPFTWYQSSSQLPAITDYTLRPTGDNPGRTYMYFNGPTSYPFGHGLSYSTFKYSNLDISKKNLQANDTFDVKVDVTNTGKTKGDEVVQLYVNTPDAKAELQRPNKRLEGFQKVSLNPGETKTVAMTVKVPNLAFFDEAQNKYVIDQGRYGIQISTSSADADIQQQEFVKVHGDLKPELSVVTAKPIQEGDKEADIPSRVMYEKGKVVIPQVTVAMNDDSLYGYIYKNNSKSLPNGLTVKYSSNRPDVVSVDGNGVIRTVNGGAATITATASYHGVKKSTQFVVYVKQGELDGINVDGKPLTGFSGNNYNYSVKVPDGTNAVPQISAISHDPDVKVKVTQATSLSGTATIVTQEGDYSQTYKIGFGRAPISADFKSGALGNQWSILNEDNNNYRLTTDGLQVTTQAGNIADGSIKNMFHQQAGGDWQYETNIKLSAKPTGTQEVGLGVYDDQNNYLKVTYGTSYTGQTSLNLIRSIDGGQMLFKTTNLNATNIYLRVVKTGNQYTAYYSTDGTTFRLLNTAPLSLANPKIGLIAANGSSNAASPINAVFSYLKNY